MTWSPKSMLTFVRNHQAIFQSVCTIFYSHQQWVRVPVVLHILTGICCYMCSGFGHYKRCMVTSHCCVNFHFSDDIWSGASFYMFICCLYILEDLVRCLRSLAKFLIGLFVFLLWSLKSSWYILDTSPLPDIFFANTSSLPVCGLSSHSLDSDFWRAKFFIFNWIQFVSHQWFMILYLKIHAKLKVT